MSTQITGNSITDVLKKFAKKLSGKEIEGNSTTEVLEDFANKYDGGGGGDPVPVSFTIKVLDEISHAEIRNIPYTNGKGYLGQAVTFDIKAMNKIMEARQCEIFGLYKNGQEVDGDMLQVVLTEDDQVIEFIGAESIS